jgi:hypothetical protein
MPVIRDPKPGTPLDAEGHALVKARRKRDPRGDLAIVDQCPYCGKKHVHGWQNLGHRVSHCVDVRNPRTGEIVIQFDHKGYVLVE